MDATNELASFLTSRRAHVSPEQAGLPTHGARRVPGLRREEVASLAGVSVEYYRRLERGNASGASDLVLDALADALLLDDAERAHLFDLARATTPSSPTRRRQPATKRVRPNLQQILEAVTAPAIIANERGDQLAANPLGRALYAPLFDSVEQPPNSARFAFLDPAAQEFFPDWERTAKTIVSNLRAVAGRTPHDRALSDLVGELSTRSDAFRTWWAAHNVRSHRTGSKRIHHPVVGAIDLTYEVFSIAADEGLALAIYTTEVGSPSHDALALLASWTLSPVDDDASTASR